MKEEEFEFPLIEASERSLSRRKLVYGVGSNDAWYIVNPLIDGKTYLCPYYVRWRSMISRGHSYRYKETQPTYKDVTACEEWHSFSTFRKWMERQDWKGKQLDKDIIKPNNKVYSPETCVFVSSNINNLLTDSAATRGEYRKGVVYREGFSKFQAQCRYNSETIHLGLFPTEALAYEAYVNYKHNLILEVAAEQEDHRVRDGLLLHAQILLDTLDDNE